MKKMKYFALAALTLALGACSDENEFYGDSKRITIEAGFGATSRVATNGLTSMFEEKDAIGVYVWTGGTTLPGAAGGYVANNVTNTYDGTNWTATPQMLWQDDKTPHYFLAVYPQTDILTTNTYTLNPADQEKSDLLVATNFGQENGGIVAQTNPVPLAFGHVMAKLRVNIKFNEQFTKQTVVEHVTAEALTTASIDWQTATATATGTATGVELPALSVAAQGYAYSYESVMVPQSGFKSVAMVIGGDTYTFTSTQEMQLKKGTITTLNLSVGLTSVEVEDISILDWTYGTTISGYLNNIDAQIAAINASLLDLAKVDSTMQALIDGMDATASAADVEALKTKHAELDKQITALQAYADSISTAGQDWASTTFATLKQYTAMQTEVAGIKALVDSCQTNLTATYTQAIANAILTSETSMKAWVNDTLATGYYDIATIDAKLSAISASLAESDSIHSAQIAAQQKALDEAKEALTAAYEKAINDAIAEGGSITTVIANAVKVAQDALQAQIDDINIEIETIKEEIAGIKESINTINGQITNINNSLTQLGTVDATLQDLIDALEEKAEGLQNKLDTNSANAATKKELEDVNALIKALQEKDVDLQKQITSLKTYVEDDLPEIKEWVEATTTTLEKFTAMQTTIAALQALVEKNQTVVPDAYKTAMNEAIDASKDKIVGWVNEELQTALAQPLADIANLQTELAGLASSAATDEELADAVAKQTKALNDAKTELTAAYEEAISTAISENNAIITTAINTVKAAQDALQGKIDTINSEITGIKNRLDKLEARIQSIRFLPEYSDGKVKFEPEMTSVALTFIVSPKEAAAIAADKVTAFIYHTQSRAVDAKPLTITAVSGNAETGMLTVTVTPPAEDYWATSKTANIYIQIDDDNNDIISEMIPAFYYVEPDYVTFSAESEQTFSWAEPSGPRSARTSRTTTTGTFEYSVGGGEWQALAENQTVTFGGTNGDLRLRGIAPEGTNGKIIAFGTETLVACSGDIRTLVDWENHTGANTENAVFEDLFNNCTQLTSAPALPATTLAEGCYYKMFYGCTNLTTPPTLSTTQLAVYCYGRMFYGCSSLSTAPALPATELAVACYEAMFFGCTSLTAAPELKATTLVRSCYNMMFQGCSKLSSVTMLATEGFDEDYCLDSWLFEVNPTGTFTRAEGMTAIPTNSVDGIPTGWTVKVKSVEQEQETLPGFNYVNGY